MTTQPTGRDRNNEFLDSLGVTNNRDQLLQILHTIERLAQDDASRLDLKITNAALKEMREAFRIFAPYRDVRKVTMFGSARTLPDDPLYAQARDLARTLAGHGWSTVTGAGPGIMAAGLEGAGKHSGQTGMGLAITRGRLESLYGERQSLVLRNVAQFMYGTRLGE